MARPGSWTVPRSYTSRCRRRLADRLKESAERLHVSRSLLAREAIERGIKPATDALRAKVRRLRDASTDTNGGAQSDA